VGAPIDHAGAPDAGESGACLDVALTGIPDMQNGLGEHANRLGDHANGLFHLANENFCEPSAAVPSSLQLGAFRNDLIEHPNVPYER
jgi:hypothetical protein